MHKFAKSDGKQRCDGCEENDLTGDDKGCTHHRHIEGAPSLHKFLMMVRDEVYRARMLYDPEAVGNALTEEVGELAAAYVDEPRANVIKEAVQVCAMAIRTALEGDSLLDIVRQKRGLDR